jgi:hypothetical protein
MSSKDRDDRLVWSPVPDDAVRQVWRCPECKAKERVTPDFYQDNGTPMCTECDENMVYFRTEIRKGYCI